jgi:hypothetical protein
MASTVSELPLRERLGVDAADLLRHIPGMGKVMVATSLSGATLERIGPIEAVTAEGGLIGLKGAAHDASIDAGAVAEIVADRTSRMGDRAFPRLDFLMADGGTLFSIVAFDGLEPFDAVVSKFGPGAPQEPPAVQDTAGERADPRDDDPGREPLDRAVSAASEITIGLRRPGFEQRWRGKIETVRPAMGFINIIPGDFHLHLKAGAITGWRRDGQELHAQAGEAMSGLYVSFE